MNKTKQKILETMYELVAQKGYDKCSIAQICEKIGIKKPSVYYYFKSKEEIFSYLCNSINEDMLEKLKKTMEISLNKDEYIDFLVEYYVKEIKELQKDKKQKKFVMEYLNQSSRIESIRIIEEEYITNSQKYIRKVLEKGQKLEVFKDDFDVELNMQIIFNTIQGIEDSIIFGVPTNAVDIWKETIRRMLIVEGK